MEAFFDFEKPIVSLEKKLQDLRELSRQEGVDFGRELIPAALQKHRVKPYLYRGYWADVGTIRSFYEANVMLGRVAAPFRFWDPSRPIYTHFRHLPGSRLTDCQVRDSIVNASRYPARRAMLTNCALGQCDRIPSASRFDP